MAFIQAKAIKVYYTKGDRKPYDVNGKPLSYLGQESIGANIATQVRFYLGEDLSESITPIVVTKRADGDRHFDILAEGTDTEVTPNQKYYYVDLSNWYAEKVGKLTLALKVYSGTVTIEDDEITASTGRIVVSDIFHIDVAYAPDASDLVPPFDPDYYEELLEALANKVERQEVIQVVNTLPTVSSADNGKWFLVRQTNGGRLYRVLGGVAVEVETEMGKLKLTPVGNGDITTNTGRFAWEQPNGTVELGLYNDVVLHLGEDVMYYAKADGSIVKGDVVQFAGYQGDHAIIKKAVPSEINAQPKLIMGIAKQNFLNNEFGYVLAFGKLESVDTKGYTNGTLIWFDSGSIDTGKWTNVVPTAPNAKVLLAVVVKQESSSPANNGVILVRPTFESKLDDLQNVLITSAVSGNVLRYDGTKWVNTNALTTAESDIDTLQSDVIGLDNTKADLTYVDSQDTNLSNRITFIETNGGIDFIKVANFASLPTSGDVRNHRLFMTIDTKQLWEFDGTQYNESSPTDLSTIEVSADLPNDVAMNVIGDSTLTADILRVRDGNGDIVAVVQGDGDVVLEKDLVVEGNLTVNGTTTTVNTTTVAIEDNIILINSNQTGTPSETLKGGIEIERGDSTNYQFVFDESDDRFKVGQVGSLQTVATRQDDVNMVANGVPFYNDTEKRFDTSSNITTISNNSIQLSGGGTFRSNAGLISTAGSANAYVNTATTGTTISRNIADANHSLIVNLANASSTGNIANFQWQGTNRLEITRDGFLNQNGTRIFSPYNQSTFVGIESGTTNATGLYNDALGYRALRQITSGNQNTAIGRNSLQSLTTQSGNVGVGYHSGISITGTLNTFVGNDAGNNASQLLTATNSTAIGNSAFTDKSNQMVFGNASVSEFKFDRNTSAIVLMPQLQTSSSSPSIFERTGTDNSSLFSSFSIRRKTTADMADGFGNGLSFEIIDNAGVVNQIGVMGALRSGADNSGRLTFLTNNAGTLTEKMTILPNGNVGIGTPTPATTLEVVGQTTISSATFPPLRVERTTTDTNTIRNALVLRATTSGDMVDLFGSSLQFRIQDSAGVDNFIGEIATLRSGADNSGRLVFRTNNAGTDTEKMTILPNGNVGIGTIAPTNRLTVLTSANTDGIDIRRDSGTTNDYARLGFRVSTSFDASTLAEIRGVRTNRVVGSDTDLTFHTFSNSVLGERMRIRDDGNVGIGTTTPVSRLDVTGDIRSSTGNYLTGSSTVFHGFNNGTINFGVPTNGNALVVNDIAGARYAISTGGFDLTFSKHRASDGAWLKSFTLEGDGANNNPTGFKFFVGTTEAFMMNSSGNVGINETSPTAQLQVKSGATTRVPLIIDTLASQTANLAEWRVNGSAVAIFDTNGRLFTSGGLSNALSGNNALIRPLDAGTTISRNIADANPSLIINQANTSSTGNIQQWQFGGTTQANIARDGIANFTGTPSNEQTGNYTLVLADKGKVLRVNSSSNRTITIPKNSVVAFPIDTEIALLRYGTGTVSIAPVDGDVTLNSISSNRKVKDRYGSCALKKIGTDEWVLVGSLEA
jgi:hypothetical protein